MPEISPRNKMTTEMSQSANFNTEINPIDDVRCWNEIRRNKNEGDTMTFNGKVWYQKWLSATKKWYQLTRSLNKGWPSAARDTTRTGATWTSIAVGASRFLSRRFLGSLPRTFAESTKEKIEIQPPIGRGGDFPPTDRRATATARGVFSFPFFLIFPIFFFTNKQKSQ